MAINQLQRAVGLFPTRREAELALGELRDAGFSMDQVSAIARDAVHNDQISGVEVKTPEERAKGGAEAGAVAGGLTGGLAGLIGGLGLLAIPGIGAAAEVGLLLGSTLLGGGFGVAGGGLVGALIGWGIPEAEAKYYDERVTQGDYLVIVEGTDNEVRQAEAVLSRRNIRDWYAYDVPSSNRQATGIR